MKAVLISIQPKWCEKIASGEKTIEVRKTKPNLATPFKVYIYCTKGKDLLREVDCWNTKSKIHTTNYKIINLDYCTNKIANGKVIGEFVCDRIAGEGETIRGNACLTVDELVDYCNGKDLYFWHISNLKIYDKPKVLSEFMKAGKSYYCDISCKHIKKKGEPLSACDRYCDKYETYLYYYDSFLRCNDCLVDDCFTTIPPQSWCYVEVE